MNTMMHYFSIYESFNQFYDKYEPAGRNSGNSRNGKRSKTLRTQTGDVTINVPRDRNGDFQSPLLERHAANNALEEKIINLYAKGIFNP